MNYWIAGKPEALKKLLGGWTSCSSTTARSVS
jgi:hypothetical protein